MKHFGGWRTFTLAALMTQEDRANFLNDHNFILSLRLKIYGKGSLSAWEKVQFYGCKRPAKENTCDEASTHGFKLMLPLQWKYMPCMACMAPTAKLSLCSWRDPDKMLKWMMHSNCLCIFVAIDGQALGNHSTNAPPMLETPKLYSEAVHNTGSGCTNIWGR